MAQATSKSGSTRAEIDEVKYQVAVATRMLAKFGLADGATASMGHASMRLPSDPTTFVVKGRDYEVDALTRMRPEDMVLCDLEGYKLDGPPGVRQCNEVKMHSCIFKARPDVQSVVHVHPRFTVAMSVLKAILTPVCLEGIDLVLDPLPVYPRPKLILTEEDGQEVARTLGKNRVILLFGHGATTAGRSLEESVLTMLRLEEQAKMNWYLYCAAGPDHPSIPRELALEMINRPKPSELPHFKDLVPSDGYHQTEGVWRHYFDLVSREM